MNRQNGDVLKDHSGPQMAVGQALESHILDEMDRADISHDFGPRADLGVKFYELD
jgi:hypothetical protein